MATVEARVQHGQNADRLYYRCSTCGFHSWVEGESGTGGDRYPSGAQQTRQVVVDRPCVSSDPSVNAKMQRAKRVLRDVFGHNAFRPNQERTVMEAFSGRDVFVLMPTGGGKSLCFQLPACIDDGVTIVISPLVSLIQDQVQQLEALDVGVANLNSDQDYDTVQRPIISELFSNSIKIKMLYVTPEKIASSNLLNNLFESLEKRGLLARFVIDEAHCISQWGHDFRKDYMNLGTLRSKYPSVRDSF
jgi:bloom syndrome protein